MIEPLNMAPGDTVYAPISIATATTTTTGASVTLTGATAPTDPDAARLFNALTYEVRTIAAGGVCDATTFTAGVVWHASSALTVAEETPFVVDAGQANPEHLCFAVNLPDNDTTGADNMQALSTGPVVWSFTGESIPNT